jgi:hypothetical protein
LGAAQTRRDIKKQLPRIGRAEVFALPFNRFAVLPCVQFVICNLSFVMPR